MQGKKTFFRCMMLSTGAQMIMTSVLIFWYLKREKGDENICRTSFMAGRNKYTRVP